MFLSQIVLKEFEVKLDDCLNVNDGSKADDVRDNEISKSRIKPPVVKRQTRGGKKQPLRKGRKYTSSESSDSETENQPPRRRKTQKARIVQSESEEEPVTQKKTSTRTKIIQESTSSGKKRLSENNSFELDKMI